MQSNVFQPSGSTYFLPSSLISTNAEHQIGIWFLLRLAAGLEGRNAGILDQIKNRSLNTRSYGDGPLDPTVSFPATHNHVIADVLAAVLAWPTVYKKFPLTKMKIGRL